MSEITCSKKRPKVIPLSVHQQGDTFPVYMMFKDDDEIQKLYDGLSIVVAFYNSNHKLILKRSSDDGTVYYDEGLYTLIVSHEDSIRMVGRVYVELTLTANNGTEVYHGDKVVTVDFEPRMNNYIL